MEEHVLTDDQGIPISVGLSAANTPDIKGLIPVIVPNPPYRERLAHLGGSLTGSWATRPMIRTIIDSSYGNWESLPFFPTGNPTMAWKWGSFGG